MPEFIPGLELCQFFFEDIVRPLLRKHFPRVIYSATRLDRGSDVLGFDTALSVDHDWGPKLQIFLTDEDYSQYKSKIKTKLAEELPLTIRGYPTNFEKSTEDNSLVLKRVNSGSINHGVSLTTVGRFFAHYIGHDLYHPMKELDWLIIPQQRLRTIYSGQVYYDGLKSLDKIRQKLSWYPHDVWLFLMANQWRRLDQEEPFMGRCGDAGDELGSRLIATQIVEELMKLCFLMEKQYQPYSKWFGTAFNQLKCAKSLIPIFHDILNALNWKDREKHLLKAYIYLIKKHNTLQITPPIDPKVSPFFNRPYLVPRSERMVNALHKEIKSEFLSNITSNIGSIDQFIDSVDVLDNIDKCQVLRIIYDET